MLASSSRGLGGRSCSVVPWAIFGRHVSWRHASWRETSWRRVSWGILGFLGASWGFLGLPGPPLGAYWVLGVSWGFLGFLGVSGRVLEEFRGVSCGIPGLFGRCGWRSCPVVVVSGGCLRPVVVRLGGACVQ